MFDINDALEFSKKLALEVGEIQKSGFRSKSLVVESKTIVTDLVTEIDKKCESYIKKIILDKYPTHSILGEEEGKVDNNSPYLWVIDPLDGTNNFAQGIPFFCVSIGLRYEDKTILGVVYAPITNDLFYAGRGHGAYLNGDKIQVSKEDELNKCILGSGFPYDKGGNPLNNVDNASKIIPKLRGFRRLGGAAYDLSLVAGGFLDGFWELDLKPWDAEAAVLIVEEAGGVVKSFRDDRNISIVAGNEKLVDKILTNLNKS